VNATPSPTRKAKLRVKGSDHFVSSKEKGGAKPRKKPRREKGSRPSNKNRTCEKKNSPSGKGGGPTAKKETEPPENAEKKKKRPGIVPAPQDINLQGGIPAERKRTQSSQEGRKGILI